LLSTKSINSVVFKSFIVKLTDPLTTHWSSWPNIFLPGIVNTDYCYLLGQKISDLEDTYTKRISIMIKRFSFKIILCNFVKSGHSLYL